MLFRSSRITVPKSELVTAWRSSCSPLRTSMRNAERIAEKRPALQESTIGQLINMLTYKNKEGVQVVIPLFDKPGVNILGLL